MNQKTGKCIDCGYLGAIIAKRCVSCYWPHRASLKKDRSTGGLKKSGGKKSGKELGIFFASQIRQIPKACEECGTGLSGWRSFLPAAIIAHILPKRETGFPEVATEENNIMFFCPDCHTDFDNKGESHARQMKSLPIMKERLKLFYEKLTDRNKNRVPAYLMED